jgi:4-diphosphocytidyl-2-C-methyl-D-erythritol kinase
MILFPAAKINIGLYVYGVRPDGFHNLETVFFPVGPFNSNLQSDILEIVPAETSSNTAKTRIFQTGISYPGAPEDNLCMRAYNLMAQEFKLPAVNIHLRKQIPVGAGLGGGSADAACMLLGLNKMFALNLSNERLAEFAAKLGSDCPFFIYNRPMLGTGRGEVLRPLFSTENGDAKENGIGELANGKYRIKIIKPDCSISTGHAYSLIKPRAEKADGYTQHAGCARQHAGTAQQSFAELVKEPVENWKNKISNDFEEPVFKEHPELAAIKQQLIDEGAIYASLSGSGSAIYGIYKSS